MGWEIEMKLIKVLRGVGEIETKLIKVGHGVGEIETKLIKVRHGWGRSKPNSSRCVMGGADRNQTHQGASWGGGD